MAIITSTFLGFLNGLIVTRANIPSFIATLGTMLAYRGIVRAVGGGSFASYKGADIPLFKILNGDFTLLNNLFHVQAFRTSMIWFALLAIIFIVILMRTRFGNWVFAVGGLPGAALAQGVNVNYVKVMCFTITGFLVAIASVLQFSHRLSVDPLRGDGIEMIAVAASAIGGIRLTGGFGTILGAVFGTFLLQMLDQGLVLMGIPIQVFQACVGLIIIISVISNTYLGKSS
jgi:simple sugar transport system permease protein